MINLTTNKDGINANGDRTVSDIYTIKVKTETLENGEVLHRKLDRYFERYINDKEYQSILITSGFTETDFLDQKMTVKITAIIFTIPQEYETNYRD